MVRETKKTIAAPKLQPRTPNAAATRGCHNAPARKNTGKLKNGITTATARKITQSAIPHPLLSRTTDWRNPSESFTNTNGSTKITANKNDARYSRVFIQTNF